MLLASCVKDLGNYEYDFDSVPKIKIDTAGVSFADIYKEWNQGDTINCAPRVVYENGNPEDLEFSWFVMDFYYSTVQVGNDEVYPPADTISHDLQLNYIVDLEPGSMYQLWLKAEDKKKDLRTYFRATSFVQVVAEGTCYGMYCLQQKDGRIDIDVLGSSRALIQTEKHEVDYWSRLHPGDILTGEVKLFHYSTVGGWFYLFTDTRGMRISPRNMVIMEEWEDMFYSVPDVYDPQALVSINGADYLINDGKLHILTPTASDRHFTAPIPGDYNLAPFLASQTKKDWGHVDGAIDADAVVFDLKQNGFRPYYNGGTALGRFNETLPDALFDLNNMKGRFLYANSVNSDELMCIMVREDGTPWLDVLSIDNVVDNGNLARYSMSLEGCPGIAEASCFASGEAGPSLFYGIGNKVYSFSYATGQTSAHLMWEGAPGEEITCLQIIGTGGFPMSGRMLWICVWNPSTQKGRIVEFEFNPINGEPESVYGPEYSGIDENPVIWDGYGKVLYMKEKHAYN